MQNRGFNRGSRATRGGALTPRSPLSIINHAAAASQVRTQSTVRSGMGLGFNLGWERQKLRDDAKRADANVEAKPAPAFRSRAPSFRREELRRERATEAEPAPLLLERFFMVTPVAAAPKE